MTKRLDPVEPRPTPSVQEGPAGQGPWSQIVAGFAEIFRGLWRAAGDSLVASSGLALLMVAAGFGAFYIAWRGAAATLVVSVQLSYLASGGLGGLGLVSAGMGVLYIQASRHLAAREAQVWAELIDRTEARS